MAFLVLSYFEGVLKSDLGPLRQGTLIHDAKDITAIKRRLLSAIEGDAVAGSSSGVFLCPEASCAKHQLVRGVSEFRAKHVPAYHDDFIFDTVRLCWRGFGQDPRR